MLEHKTLKPQNLGKKEDVKKVNNKSITANSPKEFRAREIDYAPLSKLLTKTIKPKTVDNNINNPLDIKQPPLVATKVKSHSRPNLQQNQQLNSKVII